MRIVAEIPHNRFKIAIYSWNKHYSIRVGLDDYEQSFRISEEDVTGLEQVKKMVDEEFLNDCFHRFLSMRNDFIKAYKKYSS